MRLSSPRPRAPSSVPSATPARRSGSRSWPPAWASALVGTRLGRRAQLDDAAVTTGPVRIDRRTRRLVSRLRPGDIALIDHLDLDRVTAEALVSARVAAVLNARPSISGRYPTLGPDVLMRARIPLVDDLGEGIFNQVRDGDQVTVDGDTVHSGGHLVGRGIRQDQDRVALGMAQARTGLAVQLEAFVSNTVEYLNSERDLLLDGAGVPAVRTRLAGRPCVVVVRGYSYQDDLALLGPYLREFSPVLIGVDGGADALLAAGLRPDIIVGDMDAVSDDALRCGAELVVRVSPTGRGHGTARLTQLNLAAVPFPAAVASEDLALLLADAKGASPIVAVGTHATLDEFLDRGRSGMASSLLTRLRVGAKLVDATVVARLHRPTITNQTLAVTVGTVIVAMAGAAWLTMSGQSTVDQLAVWWDQALTALRGLL
jgi:uncharacterized membrane-anchored protein